MFDIKENPGTDEGEYDFTMEPIDERDAHGFD